jgi:hypothetical protein
MNTNIVVSKNLKNCQTKNLMVICNIIICLTLLLVSSVDFSSVNAVSPGKTQGIRDAVNTQKPDVKPPDTGTVEFKCDQFKCTCKGVIDCFNMGAANVCSDNLAPKGKGVYTCTHKS